MATTAPRGRPAPHGFRLAGVVCENAPRKVTEDLTIGERATQVALPDLRVDRTGEFAIGKGDAGSVCGHYRFLQEFGPDLVTEPARAAMDGDDDVVCGEPERPGDRRLEDFRDRLHLEIVVAGAERAHLPTLPFLDAVGDVLRHGIRHDAENAALRDQLIISRRKVRGRVRLAGGDRLFSSNCIDGFHRS